MEAPQPREAIRDSEERLTRRTSTAAPIGLAPTLTEASIVERPPRSPEDLVNDAPTSPKSQLTRRKSHTTKRKALFGQRWVVNDHLIITEELKQLEARAEQINQLLAERASQKAKAAENLLLSDSGTAFPRNEQDGTIAKPQAGKPQAGKAKVIATIGDSAIGDSAIEDAETEQLQAQLNKIHALLADLGDALAEGSQIEKFHLRSRTEIPPIKPPDREAVPSPETSLKSTQSKKPQPSHSSTTEAMATAAALRRLANRGTTPSESTSESMAPELTPAPATPVNPVVPPRDRVLASSQTPKQTRRRRPDPLRQLLQLPRNHVDKLVNGLLWVVVAALARIGANLVLSFLPFLYPVAIALMLTPAAIALYLTVFVPKSGLLPVYRLFLVMMGLLLGGKL